MRLLCALPLLSFLLCLAGSFAHAAGGDEAILQGLLDASRQKREAAEEAARNAARLDPAGVAGLWERLDLRGRAALLRALAGAGTSHGAQVALRFAATEETILFRALLQGLAEGGEAALFTELPAALAASRRAAIETLRLRWRIEEEFVRLKSPTGPTGHYTGQFARLKPFGADSFPALFDILHDRESPTPGEGSAGPYRGIHPGLLRFDSGELRVLVAYSFGELVPADDSHLIGEITQIFLQYWNTPESKARFERDDLAPALAYSLHDLGVQWPAKAYIRDLERRSETGGFRASAAIWELGFAHMRIGEHAKGEAYYMSILDRIEDGSRYLAAYNLACNFSIRAQREKRDRVRLKKLALDYLDRALQNGFVDWQWMQTDGDLDFIRDEPRYAQLLSSLQEEYPDRRKGEVSKKLSDFLREKASDLAPEPPR